MGILSDLGKAALGYMQSKSEKINEYRDMYDDYDDEKLIRTFKNSSSAEKKIATGVLLKERGITKSDLE